MSIASSIRTLIPTRFQPVARFHYERSRGLLERELPIFCSLIAPNDVVVDVGANVGVYVHAFRRRGAIVEAFEPQPACASILQAYAAASQGLVRVHTTALGAAHSTARLTIPREHGRLARASASLRSSAANSTDGAHVIDVPVRPLDSYELRRVSAIKIDVEGFELDVLGGASETLRRSRPHLLIEVEQRHHTPPITQVFDELERLGYLGQFLLPGEGLRPLSDFRVREHQRLDANGQPAGMYINNFFFRAR